MSSGCILLYIYPCHCPEAGEVVRLVERNDRKGIAVQDASALSDRPGGVLEDTRLMEGVQDTARKLVANFHHPEGPCRVIYGGSMSVQSSHVVQLQPQAAPRSC